MTQILKITMEWEEGTQPGVVQVMHARTGDLFRAVEVMYSRASDTRPHIYRNWHKKDEIHVSANINLISELIWDMK